jgi:uncharacterized protein
MNSDKWEAICDKCGKCCYEKVDLGAGEIVYTDEPCEHLDTGSNLCKVYRDRHEVVPECMSLTEHLVRKLKWLPEECAYVEHIRHLDTLASVRAAQKRKERFRKNRRR